MNFIDQAEISIRAGKGGDGCLSFRREKFIAKGGPDGGNGGKGGDVILLASSNQNSLAAFRHSKVLKAESGMPGANKKKHGKNGHDLIIDVPVGTEAKNSSSGKVVADLVKTGQRAVVALGGRGGYGNAHFVSSTRQAPNFAEKGEPGEQMTLSLELKLLADVGLVGLPNAGKSTLLGALSNARPKVADYPFTTLHPSVGVVDIDSQNSLLFADIPGLIEGAAKGKGLGHDFLRHIERTSVIVHVIDAYVPDIAAAYLTIRNELSAYSKELSKRPEVVVINKAEGIDGEQSSSLLFSLRQVVKPKSTKILLISAKSGLGLQALVRCAKTAKDKSDFVRNRSKEAELFEFSLPADSSSWTVKKQGDHFTVEGQSIKRFALRTDFNNNEAVERMLDILKKKGIVNNLIKLGIKPGDKIDVAGEGTIIF
jgi:GTP-binding protein